MADEPIIGNKKTLEGTPRVAPPPIDSAEEYAELAEALKKYKEIINSAELHNDLFEDKLLTRAKELTINDKLDIDFEVANKTFIAHLSKSLDEIINSSFFKEKIGIAETIDKAREATRKELNEAQVTDPVFLQLADLATVLGALEDHAPTLAEHSENEKIASLYKLAEHSQAALVINTKVLDVIRLTSPDIMPKIRQFLNEHVDALKVFPLEEDENFNRPRFLAALSKLDKTEKKNFEIIFKVAPAKIIPPDFDKKTIEELKKLPPVTQEYVLAQKEAVDVELLKMGVVELQTFLNINKAAIGTSNDLPVDAQPNNKAFLTAYGKALEYYSKETPKDKDGKEDETFKTQKATFGALNESLPPIGAYPDLRTGNPIPIHLAQVSASYYGLTKLFPGHDDLPADPGALAAFAVADYQNKLLQFKEFYGFQPFEIGFTPEALKNSLFLSAYETAMAGAREGIAKEKTRLAALPFTDEEKAEIQEQYNITTEDLKAAAARLGTAEVKPEDLSKAAILITVVHRFEKLDTQKVEERVLINHGLAVAHVIHSPPIVQLGIDAALKARTPSSGAPPAPATSGDTDVTAASAPAAETLIEATGDKAKAVIIYGQKALGLKEGAKISDTEFKLENWGKLAGAIGSTERAADPTILALKKQFLKEYATHREAIRIPAQSKADFKPENASAEDMMRFFEALYQRRLDTYDQNVERYALLESKHETAIEDNKKFEATLRDKLSYISPALQDEALESLKTGELSKAQTKEQITKTEFYKKLRKDAAENKAGAIDDDLWVLLLQLKTINDNLTPPNIKEGLGRSIEASKLSLEQLHGMVGLSAYNATGKIPPSLIFDDPNNVRGPGEYAEQKFDDSLFDPQVYVRLRNNGEVSMTFLAYDPEIKKIIDFLGYTEKESLTTEEVGKIAQIRMLEVAKLYGVENASDLSAAIFNGTYVPYQGDPEIRLMGDLELVHIGFGKPSRDQIPADYIKIMTDAGLDPYDELNLAGVIARYRNEKFNELYGQPDEAHALKYGHRLGYFRGLDIPKGQSVEQIRASLKGDDLTLFNDYIQSLQKVSAFIYFDVLPKEYNDLRWGDKYRNKTLEIINGKAPEPEQKPAPEAEKKAETTTQTDNGQKSEFSKAIITASAQNPDQIFALYKQWRDKTTGHEAGAITEELGSAPGAPYYLFRHSIEAVLKSKPAQLEIAFAQWKEIAKAENISFKDMLEKSISHDVIAKRDNSPAIQTSYVGHWLSEAAETNPSNFAGMWHTLKDIYAKEGAPFDVNNKRIQASLEISMVSIAKSGSLQNLTDFWSIIKEEAKATPDPKTYIFNSAFGFSTGFIDMVKNGTHGIISDIIHDANMGRDLIERYKVVFLKDKAGEMTPQQLKNLEAEFNEALSNINPASHKLTPPQAGKVHDAHSLGIELTTLRAPTATNMPASAPTYDPHHPAAG